MTEEQRKEKALFEAHQAMIEKHFQANLKSFLNEYVVLRRKYRIDWFAVLEMDTGSIRAMVRPGSCFDRVEAELKEEVDNSGLVKPEKPDIIGA